MCGMFEILSQPCDGPVVNFRHLCRQGMLINCCLHLRCCEKLLRVSCQNSQKAFETLQHSCMSLVKLLSSPGHRRAFCLASFSHNSRVTLYLPPSAYIPGFRHLSLNTYCLSSRESRQIQAVFCSRSQSSDFPALFCAGTMQTNK